jgi:hypothetical protein
MKNFTVFVGTPNWTEEKTALKGSSGIAHLRGFVRQK